MTNKTPAAQPVGWIRLAWLGRGRPRLQWRALLTGTLLVALAVAAYRAALWSAHWGGTFTLLALVVLLLSLLSLWFGVRRLWKVIAHLGIRSLLILSVTIVIALFLLVGSTIGTGLGWSGWSAAGQIVAQQAGARIGDMFKELIGVPDELTVAFFGRSLSGSGTPLAGVESASTSTPETLSTASSQLSSAPTAMQSQAEVEITVGMEVEVANTTGGRLRARKDPGTATAITAFFQRGTRLTVIDGPRSADGYVWWKVKGEPGEGWCAADFLIPVR